MQEPDFDDPDVEAQWCAEMRAQVAGHLAREGVSHGEIGEWPAWHVTGCVSVWAIESKIAPGSVGWWVICGDLPTDYVSAKSIKHSRAALEAIALNWKNYVAGDRAGCPPDDVEIGSTAESPELLAKLEHRADMLADWAANHELWEGE